MFSSKTLVFLVVLPVFVFCYKCAVSDSGNNNGVSECSASNFCVTIDEYRATGEWVKEMRQCDSINCKTAGKHSVHNPVDYSTTTYDCCTGDYCNSAVNKGLLALPIMVLTYVLFK